MTAAAQAPLPLALAEVAVALLELVDPVARVQGVAAAAQLFPQVLLASSALGLGPGRGWEPELVPVLVPVPVLAPVFLPVPVQVQVQVQVPVPVPVPEPEPEPVRVMDAGLVQGPVQGPGPGPGSGPGPGPPQPSLGQLRSPQVHHASALSLRQLQAVRARPLAGGQGAQAQYREEVRPLLKVWRSSDRSVWPSALLNQAQDLPRLS